MNISSFQFAPGRMLVLGILLQAGHAVQAATAPAAAAEAPATPGPTSFPARIQVDASRPLGELQPFWRFFGADEPNYATMRNGRKLLRELGQLRSGQVYFRAHNLLTSGDGTPALKWGSTGAYREDANGAPVYNWTILDGIVDAYLANGVKPYVQIGFMPRELFTKLEPYQHQWSPHARYDEIFTGWAYPPKDYTRWGELAAAWTRHWVEKYGRAEAEKWYWEVWNEANIGYWRGTAREFHKLHDFAVEGVRRALPSARVGGPDSAGHGGRWMRDFLEHCLRGTNYATGRIGTPLDFISFHAKGAPTFVDGHVRMGLANQLRTINDGFALITSYPELKDKPIVIGESDPDGCAACQGAQLGYRNTTMYSSYTAASFAREHELADRHGVRLEGVLTWAFEFEDQPYFAGFRALASNGIDLPVLNVFRMFSQMSGRRLPVTSDGAVPTDELLRQGVRTQPDVSALASLDTNKLCVLAWHYHDDDLPGPEAAVEISLRGIPAVGREARVTHYRVDREHSNAYTVWLAMGSPAQPSAAQYSDLEKAGQLSTLPASPALALTGGQGTLQIQLPRQAVSLLIVRW